MKIFRIVLAAILLSLPLPALAQQSSPGWTFGYVPSPAEWSFWFGKKVDWQGAAYCPISGCTFTGPLLTAPATLLGSGVNLGQGVNPTSPNNGDIWMTAFGLFVHFNGSTVQVSLPGSPFTITSNSASAFAVGPNGATNPGFNVDASVPSAVTGIDIQGQAAGGGVNMNSTSSATNENLNINAKGSGSVVLDGIRNVNLLTGMVCSSAVSGLPFIQAYNNTSDASSSGVLMGKNRSGGNTISGDPFGVLQFQGFANAAQQTVAQILSAQTAASSGANIPTKLELQTSNSAGVMNQKFRFDQNAHLSVVAQATPPSITAGCSGAGSSISGSGSVNDTHGTVTGQTAVATTCTVTFGTAFGTAPDCTFTGFQSAITVINSVGTASFQVTFASTANYKFSYHCNGV